ncbi:MAG: CPBP family intramembrane metalloprotease [Oscillospiraceae bacterium]|nr:CPBP family intramembrane metalloprotease [Oscillospiraceae bacterium]
MDEKKTELKSEIRRDSNINGILLLIFWVFYFLTYAISWGLAKVLPDKSATSDGIATILVYTFLYPIGISIAVFIAHKLKNRNITEPEKPQRLKDTFRKPEMPVSWIATFIIISIFLAYATSFLTVIITALIGAIFGQEPQSVTFSSSPSLMTSIATVLATTIYAPVFEELFFRATLYRNVRKYGSWSMIIIAGLTFGIWHANFAQIFFAGVVGICSCFIYEKTKSIIPSIILHFIINTIGCFATLVTNYMGIDPSSPEISTISLLENIPLLIALLLIEVTVFSICLIGFIFLICELSGKRENLKLEKKCPEISGAKKAIAYMTAPTMIAAMLIMLAFTIMRSMGISF